MGGSPSYSRTSMKVGDRTGPSTPRAAAAPWTSRVLPAPRSPASPTTSPGSSSPATAAPMALVVVSSADRSRSAPTLRTAPAARRGGPRRPGPGRPAARPGPGRPPPSPPAGSARRGAGPRRAGAPGGRLQQRLGREVAQGDHHLGVDQPDLGVQPGPAGGDLVRQRIAVAPRAALPHRPDVGVLAAQADALQQAVEELAGGADEGLALAVLVEAGGLADEHQGGGGVTLAEHHLGAALVQAAAGAAGDLGGDRLQLGRHLSSARRPRRSSHRHRRTTPRPRRPWAWRRRRFPAPGPRPG